MVYVHPTHINKLIFFLNMKWDCSIENIRIQYLFWLYCIDNPIKINVLCLSFFIYYNIVHSKLYLYGNKQYIKNIWLFILWVFWEVLEQFILISVIITVIFISLCTISLLSKRAPSNQNGLICWSRVYTGMTLRNKISTSPRARLRMTTWCLTLHMGCVRYHFDILWRNDAVSTLDSWADHSAQILNNLTCALRILFGFLDRSGKGSWVWVI